VRFLRWALLLAALLLALWHASPVLLWGALSLRAPLEPSEAVHCASCAGRCLLRLRDGGTLALFEELPPAEIRDAQDRFAPNADDLSLLRSFASNWATIDALTDRVRAVSTPPRSFRYRSEHGRGVVSTFEVAGTHRFVVHPYDLKGLTVALPRTSSSPFWLVALRARSA